MFTLLTATISDIDKRADMCARLQSIIHPGADATSVLELFSVIGKYSPASTDPKPLALNQCVSVLASVAELEAKYSASMCTEEADRVVTLLVDALQDTVTLFVEGEGGDYLRLILKIVDSGVLAPRAVVACLHPTLVQHYTDTTTTKCTTTDAIERTTETLFALGAYLPVTCSTADVLELRTLLVQTPDKPRRRLFKKVNRIIDTVHGDA
jgi:hypothetical protein